MKCFSIAARELKVAFDSPIAWVIWGVVPSAAAAFFFVLGSFFDQGLASMRAWFAVMPILLVLIAPALTMRMWSEETRSGTLELLRTLPLTVFDLVVGKFLAAFALLAIALCFSLAAPLSVSMLGDLDWGPVWSAYFGTLLLGAASIACGLFCSAITRNQVVAWLLGVALLMLCNLFAAAATAVAMPPNLSRIFLSLDFGVRFAGMTRGVMPLEDLFFFLAIVAFFLTWNGMLLQRRRWV
jgi:ABC-2 type transport system permease protein